MTTPHVGEKAVYIVSAGDDPALFEAVRKQKLDPGGTLQALERPAIIRQLQDRDRACLTVTVHPGRAPLEVVGRQHDPAGKTPGTFRVVQEVVEGAKAVEAKAEV
jgi:hypothetical protein